MAQEPTIQFDSATGNVVELVPQVVTAEDVQAALDAAQNRLNAANDAVPAREAEYAEVVHAVEASSLALEAARKEQVEASENVTFHSSRRDAHVEATRVQQEMAESTLTGGVSEDVAGESEAVEVPITVIEAVG